MPTTFRAFLLYAVLSCFLLKASEPIVIQNNILKGIDLAPALLEIGARAAIRPKTTKITSTPPFGLDENETFLWESADIVLIGLLKIKSGGKRNRTNSDVPYYSYSLEIDPLLTLRGKNALSLLTRKEGDPRIKFSKALLLTTRETKPSPTFDINASQLRLQGILEKGDFDGIQPNEIKYLRGSYYGSHNEEPNFPEDDELVFIALSGTSSTHRLAYWQSAGSGSLGRVIELMDLPYGWTLNAQGLPLSPWAQFGNQSNMSDRNGSLFCSRSKRSFSPSSAGLAFGVRKIVPDFQDPNGRDGNGFFELTLTNPTDLHLTIPTLRRVGEKILWKESLVCLVNSSSGLHQGKNRTLLPLFTPFEELGKSEATVLGPGEKISTIVNPLLFSGFPSIKGFSQLSFRFCLGKKVAYTKFYFNSAYHEKIRLKIRAGVPTRPISLAD